jgi:hypothetical protein
MADDDILVLDSVTKFGPDSPGKVAIAASHGGVYAGYLAAKARVRGVILHDAGIGKDRAGIGSLAYLDDLQIAGATIDCKSARIGDGESMANDGTISHVNETARRAGCAPGQGAMDCARAMRSARGPEGEAPGYAEARFAIIEKPGQRRVMGCDSVSLVRPEDDGDIVITASHGEVLKKDPVWGARPDVLAAVFNDAGSDAPSRLPDLDARGIAAATVSTASARIGDARSGYEDGILSFVNETARAHGAAPGMSCREFVDLMLDGARRDG